MDNVRLCEALAASYREQSEDAKRKAQTAGSEDIGVELMELALHMSFHAAAYQDAAGRLERDEMTRLGVIGSQPRGLMTTLPLDGQ